MLHRVYALPSHRYWGMKWLKIAMYTCMLFKVHHQLFEQSDSLIAASCLNFVQFCTASHPETVLLQVRAAHGSQCFSSLMALHSSADLLHLCFLAYAPFQPCSIWECLLCPVPCSTLTMLFKLHNEHAHSAIALLLPKRVHSPKPSAPLAQCSCVAGCLLDLP